MDDVTLLNPNLLKKAALPYRALNNKLRQLILHFIHKKGRVTVSVIYESLHLEQSVASQHLAIIRNEGLVIAEREGKFIFYAVNYQRLKQLHDLAAKIILKGIPSPA